MTRNILLIALALCIAFFTFGCGDDDDSAADGCKKFCDRSAECDESGEFDADQCVSDCEKYSSESSDDEEVDAACEDAGGAFGDCYLNASCEDFLALTNGGDTDACSDEFDAMDKACNEEAATE